MQDEMEWAMQPLSDANYHINELEKLLKQVKQSQTSLELTKQQKDQKIERIETIINNAKSLIEHIIKVNVKYSIPSTQILISRN